jgi:hypothetical protein
VIPAHRKQRQNDHQFESRLSYKDLISRKTKPHKITNVFRFRCFCLHFGKPNFFTYINVQNLFMRGNDKKTKNIFSPPIL